MASRARGSAERGGVYSSSTATLQIVLDADTSRTTSEQHSTFGKEKNGGDVHVVYVPRTLPPKKTKIGMGEGVEKTQGKKNEDRAYHIKYPVCNVPYHTTTQERGGEEHYWNFPGHPARIDDYSKYNVPKG